MLQHPKVSSIYIYIFLFLIEMYELKRKKKSKWVLDEYNLLVGKHLTRLTP